jgi:hypothetical protein
VTDEQVIQAVRTIALPIILVLVVGIAAKQLDRVYRHWRYGDGSPQILIRDVVFFWGLAFLFTAGAVAGVFGIILGTVPAWVILSSTISIGLLLVFAYYEFVLIGRQK